MRPPRRVEQDERIAHTLIPSQESSARPLVRDADPGRSVLDLLLLLVRSRRQIFWFTLVASIVAAVISLLLPLRYTGTTSILPPQQSTSGAAFLSQMASNPALAALAGSSLGGLKNQSEMYVAMFTSRTVEDAMINRFDLRKAYRVKMMSQARKIFEKRSTAVAGLKDGIIRVEVESSTPDQAATMANAYVEEFQKLAAGVATTEAGQRRLFFDRQLEEAKNNLADAEQDLKRTELSTGMVQPDSQSRAMIESAASIQGQIAAKEVQMRALSSSATDNNPDMVVLKEQLAGLRAQLGRFTGDTASESDLFVPKGKVPAAALDYVRKLREVKYRETIFQALASQFEMAKLDEAKQGAIFQVIDRAVPPDKRSSPHRAVLVILTAMLAFIFACLSVWMREALRAVSRDPEDGPKLSTLLAELRWSRR